MLFSPKFPNNKPSFWLLSLFIILTACYAPKKTIQTKIIAVQNISISDTVSENAQSQIFLAPYKDSMKLKMMQEVITLDTPLNNQYTIGNLGNKTADYMYNIGNAWLNKYQNSNCDFAILNNGSIRNSLAPGMVYLLNIYEAMPYENELVLVKLSSAQTDSLFNHIAKKNGAYLSQATCTIDFQKPINPQIQGKPITSKEFYWIAINSYMWLGGDGFEIFTRAVESINTNLLIRDILLKGLKEEFQSNGKINPQAAPRIRMMQNITNRH